uniref:SEFIR domain-containing protein n=1 Tax=Periophthalmus magnuspinnatus TaxID=409849 RepID=A0A3B4AJQ2_9GOBI
MAHKTTRFSGKRVFFLVMLLLPLCWSLWTKALDIVDVNSPELTCSEVKQTESLYEAGLPDPEGPVNITQVDLRPVLCCTQGQLCVSCLQLIISLTGDSLFTHPLTFPSSVLLLLREKVTFGAPVLVRVLAQMTQYKHDITIPSLEKVPSLQFVTDQKTEVIRLKVEEAKEKTLMCQMMWDETPGAILPVGEGRKEIVISLNSAAPCLCFQVWWQDSKLRRKYCPFKNQQVAIERMMHNVSVALMESARGGSSVLLWNVSAPCRLKADVWLCKRDVVSRDKCQEVTGSRQKLDGHGDWFTTHGNHWVIKQIVTDKIFICCYQYKIIKYFLIFAFQMIFSVSRWRRIVLLFVALLLASVSILGACCIHALIKGFAWRWLKDDDVKGAVGGGHVVLLYPPDDEQALPGLMCHLGSSLQALGCNVSLDLWSHAELSVLGPVPWLHSRLDQLQRHGGKVVLVLTQAARRRAEEWGAKTWARFTTNQKDIDGSTNSNCVDVFSASLSCILADYLQGRAGERFMLVQFESLPPEGVCQPLPELFRGLHVYSLPSQSLGFLTELAGARQMATSSSRRKRAHGLRMASRALARGLSGFTAGTAVLRLAVMPQSCVGGGGEEEDVAETIPLQPYLITPPSSPDTNPKVCQVDWV